MSESLSNDQLLSLYNIAIGEYRFQVRLNWDRTAFYLTLNSGLIAIATGLLKIGGAPLVNLVVAAVFLVGLCTSWIGIRAVRKGHEYYRRTVVKKTLLEDQLGLIKPSDDYTARHNLAVGTTVGQSEHFQILDDTENWLRRPLGRGSVTFLIVVILSFFCLANAIGISGCIWLYGHPAVTAQPPPVIRVIPLAKIVHT